MNSAAEIAQGALGIVDGLADTAVRCWLLGVVLPMAVGLLVSLLAAGLLLREWFRSRRSDDANA
jgi:hypothetical protein